MKGSDEAEEGACFSGRLCPVQRWVVVELLDSKV